MTAAKNPLNKVCFDGVIRIYLGLRENAKKTGLFLPQMGGNPPSTQADTNQVNVKIFNLNKKAK
jgi:hypothetical protein